MKNKFLPLVGLLSAIGVSPVSNAMQQNGSQQNNAQQQNNQNSQNGFTVGQVAAFSIVSALGGATLGGVATNRFIGQKALDDAKRSLEDEKTHVNNLQTELNDKNKKIKDFEKQVKKLEEENKKLKSGVPNNPGCDDNYVKAIEKQNEELEKMLNERNAAYDKLLKAYQNGTDNGLIEVLQFENNKLKEDLDAFNEECNNLRNAVFEYKQRVGYNHIDDCHAIDRKLDYIKTYYKKFYDADFADEIDLKSPCTPLYGFYDTDLSSLKDNQGKYQLKPLSSVVAAYIELCKEKNGNLEDNDYLDVLKKGFLSQYGDVESKKIFLNLKLLYCLLRNTSNITDGNDKTLV